MRSLLFVPGDRSDLHTKARDSPADVVIFDLEDAITKASAPDAREAVRRTLQRGRSRVSQEQVVRVGPESMDEDLSVIAGCPLYAIMLAKADLDGLNGAHKAIRQSWPPEHRPRLIGLVESAVGILQVEQMAEQRDVDRLMIGEIDLAADLGIEPDLPDGLAMLSDLRLRILLASRAAGLGPPIGPVWQNIDDLHGLEADTRRLRGQGFRSRAVIHPSHIDVVNRAFAPSPEEVQRARQIVDRYQRAVREGKGAVRDERGCMLDRAAVRSAQDVLDRACTT